MTALPTTGLTDDEIETAILAVLSRSGEKLVRWPAIRSRMPGEYWRQAAALHRLHDQGRVYLTKIHGRPYVCLGDDADIASAKIAAAERRPRRVRVI